MKKSKGKRKRLKWERAMEARIPKKEVTIVDAKTKEPCTAKAYQADNGDVYIVCNGSLVSKEFEVLSNII